MTIHFKCPNPDCDKVFSAPEEWAGKRATCKKCGKSVLVPAGHAPLKPPQESTDADDTTTAPVRDAEPPTNAAAAAPPPPAPDWQAQAPAAAPPASYPQAEPSVPAGSDADVAAAPGSDATAASPEPPAATPPPLPPKQPAGADSCPSLVPDDAAEGAVMASGGISWDRWFDVALDFLAFRFNITPSAIVVAWALLAVATVAGAWQQAGIGGALAGMIVALVFHRIYFEWLVVWFRINESAAAVCRSLQSDRDAASDDARSTGQWVLDVLLMRSLGFVYIVWLAWVVGSFAMLFVIGFGSWYSALLCIAGVVVWRMVCEVCVVLFQISNTLAAVRPEDSDARPETTFSEFFALRCMVTPWLARAVWILGGVLLVGLWLAAVLDASVSLPSELDGLGLSALMTGSVFGLLLSLLGLRLVCEFLIVLQTIYESSRGLRAAVALSYPAPSSTPLPPAPAPHFFRWMITPGLIQSAWALGSAAIVVVPVIGLVLMIALSEPDADPDAPARLVALGLPLILLALLVWRLFCENLVVMFAVNECVKESGTLVRLAEGDAPVESSTRAIDFLTFRSMLAIPLIQVVWILGALIVTAIFLYWGSATIADGETFVGVLLLSLTPFALLAHRVSCEWGIVAFAMNATIGWMGRAMPAPAAPPAKPKSIEPSAAAQKFAGGVEGAKRFVRVQKLRLDVKSLRSSLNAQRANLGSLAHQGHVAVPGAEADDAELSQLQHDLTERQAKLDSLQATDRRNPAVREVKRELAELNRRQQELILAIGAKVDAVRADIPGAAPVYSAIDQLCSSLDAKQAKLEQLGASSGRAAEDARVSMQLPDLGVWMKPFAIAGAVLGVALLLWFFGSMIGSLGGFGLPKWARSCASEDVTQVSYMNLKKLRDSEQYDKLARFTARFTASLTALRLRFGVQPEELEESVVIRTSDAAFDHDLVLFRTIEDLSLDDLAEQGRCRREEIDGTECLVASAGFMGSLYLAKTGTRTYCYAGDRQSAQDALARIAGRRQSELKDELKASLSQVAENDVYHAGFNDAVRTAFTGLKVFSMGLSTDSSKSSFEGEFVFSETAQAQEYTKTREDQIEQIRQILEREGISEEERERVEHQLDVVERLKASRRDCRVHCHGKWPATDAQDAINLVLQGMTGVLR